MHPALLNPSFSSVDRHFADMLSRQARLIDPDNENSSDTINNRVNTDLVLLFARLSQTLGQQNTCLMVQDPNAIDALKTLDCVAVLDGSETKAAIDLTIEKEHLEDHLSLFSNRPLVMYLLNENSALLYTQRYFAYELRIAMALSQRNRMLPEPGRAINALQPFLSDADDHFQKIAALQAVTRQLTIISGGPGTGKTSTVVKILAGLVATQPDLRIQLAAPTGKAAMRLSSSIQTAVNRLGSQTSQPAPLGIPTQVSTLHRLLGVRGDGQNFRYHRHNQLPIDVLILDEASMIDLAMFDRVLQAIKPQTRVIILGDPAQLPSVDSGKVMLDITQQGEIYSDALRELFKREIGITLEGSNRAHYLADAHCSLKTSYRFKDNQGIGQLAHQLRLNSPEVVHSPERINSPELVNNPERINSPEPTLNDKPATLTSNDQVTVKPHCSPADVINAMSSLYQPFLHACKAQHSSADDLLDLFDQARLLTPIRDGELGVTQLNAEFQRRHFDRNDGYYHGKPVMIMKNHYALRLFNGDIGVCVKRGNEFGNKIEVAFKNSDGELEYYIPSRLPKHETCFAMTVHKSQGSEFEEVCLVLPSSEHEEFINRELVYTGITRAKSKLIIFSEQSSLQNQSSQRTSGLAEMLRKDEVSKPKPSMAREQLDLF